jgi:hypothetical protein
MGHKRSEIKNIVKELLFENTACNQNVFINRLISFEDDIEFPSIVIYMDNEEVIEEIQPNGHIREVDLNIVIYNRTELENDIISDLIANQIEACIAKFKSNDFTFSYIKTKYDASYEHCVSNNETTILTYRVKYDSYNFDSINELDNFDEITLN